MGLPIKKTYNGKEYEIERYQGVHSREYCVYEMKNGIRDGSAELFEDGMVKLHWLMRNGVRDGWYVLYEKGVVVMKGRWVDVCEGEERVIENHRTRSILYIRVNGIIVYKGGYNEEMQRHGLGYEYENGVLKRFGRWEMDELVEEKQFFVNDKEMIEYACECFSDLLSHIPIFIGGYRFDEMSGLMKRNGVGRMLDENTGICKYESEWENGIEIESKRVLLYDGWYSQNAFGESESTRRAVNEIKPIILDSKVLIENPVGDEELLIKPNDFNDSGISELTMSYPIQLKRIVIGDNCFGSIRVFELDELSELDSIVVGKKCFTNAKTDDAVRCSKRIDGVYRLMNCPKLKSIQIRDFSFSDYHSFELNNLPSLQSIDIGYRCFYHVSSFSLAGLIDWLV